MTKEYAEFLQWEQHKPENFFASDTNFQRLLNSYGLKNDSHSTLLKVGFLSATNINELAIESNKDENLPKLKRYDPIGNRTESIEFHPSYHELGTLIWDTGVLSVLEHPGNHILASALVYLMGHNGEAGHLCPIACTAGGIRLIQELGTSEQKEKYLPRLLDRNYQRRIHASQFLTEIQGGSDVGANTTYAEELSGNTFRIYGQKWFCSVADAELFVVTAKFPKGAEGTKGLGLFLVPRMLENKSNGFEIRKLKSKLGTRSMATAEIDFTGALAERIGPLDQGFNNAVRIVLDTSRIYNAVVACGMMRRAYIEGQTYSKHRTSFGKPIAAYPLVQKTLARMHVDSSAALATTFRILHMGDLLDLNHNADIAAARRINVMINKYWTSLRCTETVHRAIEILGGNGTIEDFSVLPRLYRDAIVLESWEGSHNVLCLQVLRDFVQRKMHEPWLNELTNTLSSLTSGSSHINHASSFLAAVKNEIDQLLSLDEERSTLEIRQVVERMCVLHGYIALLRERYFEMKQYGEATEKDAILDLYSSYYVC
jgi:alkylation response protein AidB-like acyl-CoA dehydrogenase